MVVTTKVDRSPSWLAHLTQRFEGGGQGVALAAAGGGDAACHSSLRNATAAASSNCDTSLQGTNCLKTKRSGSGNILRIAEVFFHGIFHEVKMVHGWARSANLIIDSLCNSIIALA